MTPGSALGLCIEGHYAYVADGEGNGLAIIDMSTPSSPKVVGTYKKVAANYPMARHAVVKNGYAYLAYERAGLHILDVSDPAHPRLVATYGGSSAWVDNVVVEGNYAYVTVYEQGLKILDISTPSSPVSVGSLNIQYFYEGAMVIDGDYLYLAATEFGLHLINISNPASPSLERITPYNDHMWANDMVMKDNDIYIADFNGFFILTSNAPSPNARLSVTSFPRYRRSGVGYPCGSTWPDRWKDLF